MNSKPAREYSHIQELVNNLPYIGMIVLGAAILIVGLDESAWAWITAAAYATYGLAGTFWVILFICPYCSYWNTKSCPCGYGLIAAKLRERKPGNRFNEKFKKHIPVIVPLWFIPILAGLPLLILGFSWLLLVLLVVFALDAFVILPVFSRQHGCKSCPQKDSCPWMGRKSKPSSV
jgi:hypothetical protein